jgi:hypothetical protein
MIASEFACELPNPNQVESRLSGVVAKFAENSAANGREFRNRNRREARPILFDNHIN